MTRDFLKGSVVVFMIRTFVISFALASIYIIFLDDLDEDFERRSELLRNLYHSESLSYKTECGSCHLAYPPGLLPERSWITIMDNLLDHFGSVVELEPTNQAEIKKYLTDYSAERGTRRSKKIALSIPLRDSPIRFTETQFYLAKHRHLSAEIYQKKSIVSKANCQVCHTEAESGRFYGSRVTIPN